MVIKDFKEPKGCRVLTVLLSIITDRNCAAIVDEVR
jgi:hypothetical protein